MKKVLKQILQTIVLPNPLIKKVRIFRRRNIKTGILRKNILEYYGKVDKDRLSHEEKEVIRYLKKNVLDVFPYPFHEKYHTYKIEVFKDEKRGLNYVLHGGKKLYFKRSWDAELIRFHYNLLLQEQDENSPHCYLTDKFKVKPNDVVADIGVAEGNFALGIVDKAKRVYIFEADEEWIEVLEATFEPWKDKVSIINKFVSDVNDDKNITLDSFFESEELPDFLKIDVDGAERNLLKGASKILSADKPSKIAICTYHKQNDYKEFDPFFKELGFNTEHSKGYMVFIYDEEEQSAPYLRRGLIRASK